MKTCQAPYRLPDDFYSNLERSILTEAAEAVGVDLTITLATGHACGEPAVAEVEYQGRRVPVCAWHREQFRMLFEEN